MKKLKSDVKEKQEIECDKVNEFDPFENRLLLNIFYKSLFQSQCTFSKYCFITASSLGHWEKMQQHCQR